MYCCDTKNEISFVVPRECVAFRCTSSLKYINSSDIECQHSVSLQANDRNDRQQCFIYDFIFKNIYKTYHPVVTGAPDNMYCCSIIVKKTMSHFMHKYKCKQKTRLSDDALQLCSSAALQYFGSCNDQT